MDNMKKSGLSADKQALLMKRIRGELAKETFRGIAKRTETGPAPLSFAQERMWFLEQFFPDSAVYNIPTVLRIEGELDLGVLEKSFLELFLRHEVLRTTFVTDGEETRQLIAGEVTAAIVLQDLTGLPQGEREAESARLALQEALQPFDLTKGPLVRTTVVRLSETEHVVLLTFHHIVTDGWSLGVMIGEVSELYEALLQGKTSPLGELPLQYADYAVWQREQIGGVLAKQIDYWKQQLGTPADPLELPADKPRPAKSTFEGAVCSLILKEELAAGLRKLFESEGVTLFMGLLAAFQVFLHRYTGQEDIRVGTPVAGRNRGEIEGLIGLFVNTLTLRADLSGDPAFRDFLQAVRQTCLDAFAHQDLPFEKLVEELKVERNVSQSPLFQVMFAVRGVAQASFQRAGLNWVPVQRAVETAMFDLTAAFVDREDSLGLDFEYSTDLFEAESIRRMMQHFVHLLEGVVRNPAARIGELPLLDAEERAQVLVGWNDTTTDYPRDKSVHEVFEAQAEATPERVALEFEGRSLTYRELNEKANRLARRLLAMGAGGQFVGVYMERSPELIVSLLAVLKAGAAYVPLDVNDPKDRLAYMLEDVQVAVLLTQPHLAGRAESVSGSVQTLTVELAGPDDAADNSNLGLSATGDDMAYIMYTSGSTGKPKGVCVPHRGIVRLVKGVSEYDLTADDILLQFAPTAFDAATFEIWGALLNGSKLVIFPPYQASLEELGRVLQERGVTALWLTSGLFNQMVDSNLEALQGLRLLITGGDAMSPPHAKKALAGLSCRLFNGYGPTENTTFTTLYEVKRTEDLQQGVPIGTPISNTTVYVLDRAMQPVPIGVPGELVTGGDGLALGYWNLPELTVERFVEDPFGGRPDAFLYKTGDLARWRADGTLEFLGRIDQQVKLRGFRIELGEIETTLQEHPQVLDAVVIVRQDVPGDKRLAAYVVPDGANGPEQVDARELRAFLKDRLPEHMIPAVFVVLEALPITANGKVDRRALPAPAGVSDTAVEYVEPRNEAEAKLSAIFADVLNLERVGVHDNFFALGGHSLIATQLVSRIRQQFAVELPLRSLFERPTVAALAEGLEQTDAKEVTDMSTAYLEFDDVFPLSFAQQRLWFLDQLDPGSVTYNIPLVMRIEGALDAAVLEQTFNEIVRRHEPLRTNFQMVEGDAMQVIAAERVQPLPVIDLQHLPQEARDARVQELAEREVNTPFDLAHDALLRTTLIRLGAGDHVLLLTMHHIISDGWSMGVFTQELLTLYTAFQKGQPSPLAELAIQYADYSLWQRDKLLQGETWETLLTYWKNQFRGELPVLELPTDRPRPAVQNFRGDKVEFVLPKTLGDSLHALSQGESATLYMTLLAAFNTLLYRYSGQEDIVLGAPIAGRNRAEIEPLIGFFVNTLALRTDLSGNPSFRDLLKRVRETALGGFAHQDLPFEMLVDELGIERDMSRSPLFQVSFVLQNAPTATFTLQDVTLTPLEAGLSTAKFDLTLVMTEGQDGLGGVFEFRTDLFDKTTMERLSAHFSNLLAAIVRNPDLAISELPILSEAERNKMLIEWNDTQRDFGDHNCLHTLFEAQAEHTPDEPALIFGDRSLTYRELNQQANQLARTLQKAGVGHEQLVGIAMERSMEMIIALLAVQKAGGAYLPLDPSAPADRLAYLLSDSGVRVLLTKQHHLSALPDHQAQVIAVDSVQGDIAQEDDSNLHLEIAPDRLAYVIYTSGSTGRPKGVLLEHRGACNTISFQKEALQIGTGRRMLQFAALTFDASVFEIFTALTTGAALVLAEKEQLLPGAGLSELIREQGITDVVLTPAVLTLLPDDNLPQLRTVTSAGEACPAELAARWAQGGRTFYNAYGPTETSIEATVSINPSAARTADIGRPIANSEVYVLDSNLRPVPIGVHGELYIGGAGLARGYHNRPELTAAAFIPHPFRREPGARLYRSGDSMRWLANGTLEFIGRIDNQVKIRGFRIEIGEVEAVLEQHPSVLQAAVMAREDVPGLKRLVAYMVLEAGAGAADVRAFLQDKLPDYMVPSAFVTLDEFPRNTSQKVDYRALPAPDDRSGQDAEHVEPRNAAEAKIAALYAELLGLERVGAHDHFFENGGHSLLGARLVSRIREEFQAELPLRALFEHPTVAALARLLSGDDPSVTAAQMSPLRKAERTELIPLSFAQQRLWFLDQLDPGSATYNMPLVMRVHGVLDTAALEQTFREIVRRHETLRTNFRTEAGDAVQVIAADRVQPLPVIDLQHLPQEEQEAKVNDLAEQEIGMPFDLAYDALMRTTLIKLGEQDHVLLLTMHHIITDGWSMSVFTQELLALYTAFQQGLPSPLEELAVQYADYAVWQREQLEGDAQERLLAYWKNQFRGEIPVLELPTDRPRPAKQNFRGDTVSFALPKALSDQLLALSRQEGATLYMTLLAAFNTLLSRCSGQEDIVLGAPVAGRSLAEVEPLIGFFVNTLALRTDLSGDPSFRDLIKRVRETALGGFAHGELPFEMLVEELGLSRDMSRSPLFQVTFLLQNAPKTEFTLQDVTLTPLEAARTTAKFDLTLVMSEGEDGLGGNFEYRTDLFDKSTIERLSAHFHNLLTAIVMNPDTAINELQILSEAEKQTMLVDWNQTQREFPDNTCLHKLFEAQAERTPDDPALILGEKLLTYRELNQQANQLARTLQKAGVGIEQLVGIAMERSMEMIVAILAVQKAGGAYVPLDPTAPAERLAYMLSDSGAEVLLTMQKHSTTLPEHQAQVIAVDTEWENIGLEESSNLNVEVAPDNLAYVIYTSGSTGRPKGVLLQHRGACNTISFKADSLQIGTGSRMLQFASPSFDASVIEIFTALTTGATLVLAEKEQLMPGAGLAELMREQEITDAILTPAVLTLLPDDNLPHLRTVISAGEACPAELAARWSRNGRTFINAYGPTETSIEATASINPDTTRTPDIGRPIANSEVYVLDSRLQPVPVGVPGELHIGGAGLARGYHNRPELTAAAFIPHPFSGTPGARLYKTGDLVRWLDGGTLEFIGRIDQQVKIRGFRIELGEIEAVLEQHPAVLQAAVMAREDVPGLKRLAAYLVLDLTADVKTADVRAFLQDKLPDYMVPSAFVFLDEIPRNASQKVDYRALPAPEGRPDAATEYVPPRNEAEAKIAALFAELLGVEQAQVGAFDHFFELGGHSLLGARLVSRIREFFRAELPLRALFENPTVAALANLLGSEYVSGSAVLLPPLQKAERDSTIPLSYAQQRLWFLDQLTPGSNAYNMPTALKLHGVLDAEAVQRSFNEIVRRHESLRTTFEAAGEETVQVIAPHLELDVPLIDLSAAKDREDKLKRLVLEDATRPFDLQQGPLLRAALVRMGAEEHALLVNMHHIISDAWSISLLIQEFVALYGAFSEQQPSPLSDLLVQFADYAVWERSWMQGDTLNEQMAYWKTKLGGDLPVLELPTDRSPEANHGQSARQTALLSADLTQKLKMLSREEGTTPFMTLLAAFNTLLARLTGQEDIIVGTPIANRSMVETEGLIGLLLNTLALRTDLSGAPTFRELLGRVRETTLEAFARQEVPFEKIVEEIQPDRNLHRNPVFDVMVNFVNTPETAATLPGLTISALGSEEEPASKFLMSLYISEQDEQLHLSLVYQSALFSQERMSSVMEQFLSLLEQVLEHADGAVNGYTLLTETSRAVLPDPQAEIAEPQYPFVSELFANWATHAPDQTAVSQGEQKWSYAQLHARAEKLARVLVAKGVQRGDAVAVAGTRNVGFVAAMLGVLMSGGVLVPIDYHLPLNRQQVMVEQSNAQHLLFVSEEGMTGEWQALFAAFDILVIDPATGITVEKLDLGAAVKPDLSGQHKTSGMSEQSGMPELAELPVLSPDDPAYIFFTSGTTGVPKGVLGSQKGLNHFLAWQRSTFHIGPSDRVAQLIHLSFDAVLRDVFLPLTSGATLCLPDVTDDLGGDVILPWLEREGVTVLHTVPSVAQAWATDHPQGITLRSLRHLFLAGEPLTDVLVNRLRRAFPELGDIINLYGPTETTMVKCFHIVPETPTAGIQPAGIPFPETQALVLSVTGQLCGIGEQGEIVLRTPFRTLGYVNAPEENKSFAPNPFRPHDTADQLYFTGDKGRYRPDGSLEILGRVDDQVKVRGVRIQLHEVSATLLRHEAVDACAVIDWKDETGQTQLAAYTVLKPGQSATAEDLRAHAERDLLAAMVPSAYLFLDALPRLANGKVNRKALPKPERMRGTEAAFVAPRNATEETLSAIFADVLKLEKVGVHDNFFTLGGHSLMATQLVSRVRQSFEVELPLRTLFERPTVAALAEGIQQQKGTGTDPLAAPIVPIARAHDAVLPLSFAQQRLWFLDQLDPGSIAYNLPLVMRVQGALDTEVLEKTFQAIVSRHEALRTNFQTAGGQAVQVITAERVHALPLIDLQHLPKGEQDAKVSVLAEQEIHTPFDLAQDALLRTSLIKLGEEEHILLLTMHHIISDGWSMGVFTKELVSIYTAFQKGLPSPIEELAIQYADYSVWQRGHLQGDTQAELLSYWKSRFAGDIPVLDLPTDRPRPAVQNFQGDTLQFALPKALSDQLLTLSQQEGATLYMTLLAAFKTLLSRYSGQEDIVLGAPIAGRNRAEIEPLIGFFVNTLALRTDLSGNPSFRDLLKRVRETALGGFAHQDLPLEMLIDELGIERDMSRSPLFQVTFLLQNTPAAEFALSDVTLTPLEAVRTTSKFDLGLMMTESEQGLSGAFEFRTDLFDKTTMELMAEHFCNLLAAIADNADTTLAELPMLSEAEETMILGVWSGTKREFPDNTCLHSLFEAQVERTPDDPALIFGGQRLTYRELNQQANQLARTLQKAGVGIEQLVGIVMERSMEMIVAILAVQKAGGAYVPLDLSAPEERLAYMLSDSGAGVLLTKQKHITTLPEHQAQVVSVDTEWERVAQEDSTNLNLDVAPDNLAYVIYTSGSTGRPKGVLLQHRGACNTVSFKADSLHIGTGSRMLQFASPSFDASVIEIFTALTTGAALVLAEQEQLMPGAGLAELIREQEITDVILTPAVLTLLPDDNLPHLRTITSAGEACPAELAARWSQNGRTFINAYGPTETSIEATASVNPKTTRTPDIGRPIPNGEVYILDRHLRPVPVGVPGELHIGGAGLARGYHNRPELTAAAIIAHPFVSEPGARLYKTGDLVRWLPDGNIEYLSRLDHQVKIRGFRIETGEIEAALTLHPHVEEAVVVPHTDKLGQKRLAAYTVASADTVVTPQELRALLKQSLPDYMVPSYFVQLGALPLNSSGKVDRKALPEPDANTAEHREYLPPQTETEQTLALLWQELLGLGQVSRDDNFFEIGGHSLLATQLASRIRETFRVELPLRTLFEAPTVETLAERLADFQPGAEEELSLTGFHFDETDPAPLSFAQQRLWFIDRLEPGSSAYNISNLMRLNGPLDLTVLEQSFAELLDRHESLRTIFPSRDGEPVQEVLEQLILPLAVTDLQGQTDAEAQAMQAARVEAALPFDLEKGPLVRLAVYKLSGEEHLLLLLMHHIISDGWSMGVFIRELVTLYDAIQSGKHSPLAPLPVQYTGFSRWQRSYFQGDVMQKQLGYWKQQLGGELPVLELPTDRPRPAVLTANGAKFAFDLPSQLSAALRDVSQREGATLYMTLLAAFQTLLSRYSGQQDIVVGSPIAGRNRKEIEHLIGFFINTLVLRTDLSGNPGFAELVQRVKNTTLDAYANQDVPFEMLVAELQPDRELGRTPLFQAMFVLQNTPSEGMELPGLTLTGVPLESSTAKFDLSLMLVKTDAGLQGSFEYNTDLWDAATIERMVGHFTTLLQGMTADPTQPIGTLSMLTEQETHQLLIEWNATQTDYPRESTVHGLVEQHASNTPDATALMFENKTLSYRELNEQANQLAHRLQKLDVVPGSLVGISMERSTEMIVAMVAILKAGGAFVPFDVSYPHDRLSYMFEDTQVKVLLTQARLADQLPEHGAEMIFVDTDETLAQESTANLQAEVTKDSGAYIMYTSGSTGRPKGVLVPHRGIVRLVREVGYTEYRKDDVFLQFAPIAFDVSVLEIWGALLNGGKLAIFPPHQATLAELGAGIQQYGVTTLWITTGLFHGMVEHHPEGLRGIRQVLTGGDVLSVPHAKKALEHFDGCLINAYGPTENTTFTTAHVMTDPSQIGHTVSIGRPVANTTVYVLDPQGQPVPVGVPGELYTGGDGLALGYLNRPELTEEKFVPNPFGEGKLYRTGDAVRWMLNGELEFIGRIDNQVKIRGFRVEIGEIEAALAQHPAVRDTVVVVRTEAGDKRLVAYLTAEGEEVLTAVELTLYLKQTLPDYMIPAAFVVLEELPLNPNGKVDRKGLAALAVTFESEETYTAPQDRFELELVQIWSEVLGHSALGVTDNFFTVGGHSLLAVRLMAQIEKRFGEQLPLSVLFREGTIRSLAALLREGGQERPATPLVTIQPGLPGTAARPLFLVHPVGGSAFAYLDLARELGAEQPVYGLQARGFDDGRDPLTTMEEMASEYIEAIRTVQQTGPYLLGGWSLGGTIAYEMAGQLHRLGEEVEMLALIDTRAPLPAYQREMTDQDLLLAFARDLAGQHGLDLEKLSEAELSLSEDALSALLDVAREHQVLPSDIGLSDLKRLLSVFSSNFRAFNRYVPEHKAERVLLIQAENAESGEYGWSELADEVEVHRIGGNHFTLLRAPHVQDLSGILKDVLTKAGITS